MKKFLHFDWLRAVQFLGNTVPKTAYGIRLMAGQPAK